MSTPARRLRETRATAQHAPDGSDLRALEDVSSAVEAGAGLPEVVRAAARALDASLLLSDRSGAVLAVAASSPADEQSLLERGRGRRGARAARRRRAGRPPADARSRSRSPAPVAAAPRARRSSPPRSSACARPERASEEAATAFLHALLGREIPTATSSSARGQRARLDLDARRQHGRGPRRPARPDRGGLARPRARRRRARCPRRASARRARRARRPADDARAGEVVVLVPGPTTRRSRRRAAEGVLRELEASLPGFAFAVGRSRVAADPVDLHRARPRGAARRQRRRGRRATSAAARLRRHRRLPPAAAGDEREPGRARALLRRDRSSRSSPTTSSTRPTSCRRVETFLDCDGNVAADRRSASSPTATPSATGSSACAS